MAVNENDFELLNAYLDGELPVAECEGLWRRLAVERELMSELDSLPRITRSGEWSGRALIRAIKRWRGSRHGSCAASRREDLLDRWHYLSRIVTAVAALVLFGFTIGWLGRERYIVSPTTAIGSQFSPNHVASLGPQLPTGSKVSVEVDDGTGKLVNLQFDSLDEANRFIHDFRAARAAAPPDGGDSAIVPAMDKF